MTTISDLASEARISLDPAMPTWGEQFQRFMEYRLDELKELLRQHVDGGEQRYEKLAGRLDEHERRLVKLERVLWLLTGIWILITTITVPLVVYLITRLL